MPCLVNLANDLSQSKDVTSSRGVLWDSTSISGLGLTWRSIAYGRNRWVAVSSSSEIYTSEDRYHWIARVAPAVLQWQSVCYGNGLFVAVAQNGLGNQVATSPDGIVWTSQAEASTRQWSSVCYGNGLFVAVAQDGVGDQIMTSPNGVVWTSRTEASTRVWWSICYGNGLFVAVAQDGVGDQVMTSPNGVVWTSRAEAVNAAWLDICFGNGTFVATCDTNMQYSLNGIAWFNITLPIDNPLTMCYDIANQRFVGAGTNGVTGYTFTCTCRRPDLDSWSISGLYIIPPVGTGLNDITCGENGLVCVGDNDFSMAA